MKISDIKEQFDKLLPLAELIEAQSIEVVVLTDIIGAWLRVGDEEEQVAIDYNIKDSLYSLRSSDGDWDTKDLREVLRILSLKCLVVCK